MVPWEPCCWRPASQSVVSQRCGISRNPTLSWVFTSNILMQVPTSFTPIHLVVQHSSSASRGMPTKWRRLTWQLSNSPDVYARRTLSWRAISDPPERCSNPWEMLHLKCWKKPSFSRPQHSSKVVQTSSVLKPCFLSTKQPQHSKVPNAPVISLSLLVLPTTKHPMVSSP